MFSLTLRNFRSFKNQTFDFNRFNVLIGENSSGKSSLFKFLLAAKQSLTTPTNREINFQFSGEYVDLGGYRESIYYHQEDLNLGFDFAFKSTYVDFFFKFMMGDEAKKKEIQNWVNLFYSNEILTSETTIRFNMNRDLNLHYSIHTRIINTSLGELVIEPVNEDAKISKGALYEPKCRLRYLDLTDKKVYDMKNIRYAKDGFLSIIDPGDLRASCDKLFARENEKSTEEVLLTLDERLQSHRMFNRIAFLLVAQNFVKATIERIEYINPIDTHPSRFYITKDKKKFTTINDLDDVLAYFSGADEVKLKVQKEFVKILKKMGIADDLEILEDERLPVTELRVKVKDLLSNISDVGYGVSLQLPIILKALLADRASDGVVRYVMIEQPEVHLHPRLHSSLIEILMSLSKNTVYFVETHSEHVIRKLQILAKEKAYGLEPQQVTIHYLLRKNKQSEVSVHPILESGFLENPLPTGFFDNSFFLSKQLL